MCLLMHPDMESDERIPTSDWRKLTYLVRMPADPSWQPPRQSNSLMKGQKIAIGVGIAAAALVVTYLIIRAKCDGLCT